MAWGSDGFLVIASPSESNRASMRTVAGSGCPIIEAAALRSISRGKVGLPMRLTAAGGPAVWPAARAMMKSTAFGDGLVPASVNVTWTDGPLTGAAGVPPEADSEPGLGRAG